MGLLYSRRIQVPVDVLPDYFSPTVAALNQETGNPYDLGTVCCRCPVALWYVSADEKLTCFCSALHRETWSDGMKNDQQIVACDGRIQALAKLAESTPQ